MRTSKRFWVMGTLLLVPFFLNNCYYSPKTNRPKAHPSFLSEAEAETLVHRRLDPFGIKFVYNMRLIRDNASFVADGYDRALRVGFEYRSHEGMDFEGEPGQNQDGLTAEEIGALRYRQNTFREYFLIIPEGPREQVNQHIDDFIKNLYAWEVLKKPKKPASPRKKSDQSNAIPWETSGNLKEKLREMEAREKLDQGKVDLEKEDSDVEDLLDKDESNEQPEEYESNKQSQPEEDDEDFDF